MHILIVILIILGLLSWLLAAFGLPRPTTGRTWTVNLFILGFFLIGLGLLLPTITAAA